jgi:hypothetical protein
VELSIGHIMYIIGAVYTTIFLKNKIDTEEECRLLGCGAV